MDCFFISIFLQVCTKISEQFWWFHCRTKFLLHVTNLQTSFIPSRAGFTFSNINSTIKMIKMELVLTANANTVNLYAYIKGENAENNTTFYVYNIKKLNQQNKFYSTCSDNRDRQTIGNNEDHLHVNSARFVPHHHWLLFEYGSCWAWASRSHSCLSCRWYARYLKSVTY